MEVRTEIDPDGDHDLQQRKGVLPNKEEEIAISP